VPGATRRNWRRPLAITLGAVIGVVLVVALFTGPVERLWYQTRQHHLAADLKVAREGLAPGHALGVLQIPRLGINVVVVQGDTPGLLRGGPGHRLGTALPGTRGNAVILGHHDAWGGPFRHLDQVRKRDYVAIQSRDPKTGESKTFVYRASAVAHVSADASRALMGRSTDHRLTLVTGRGGTFSNARLVVSAVSGTPARHAIRVPAARATTPGSSALFSAYTLLALLAFGLAFGAYRYLRRRAGTVATVIVLVPLLAAGTLFLLLNLTRMLPPLD
jgi:LPXTG-site transpeptidase (sortase) family protein